MKIKSPTSLAYLFVTALASVALLTSTASPAVGQTNKRGIRSELNGEAEKRPPVAVTQSRGKAKREPVSRALNAQQDGQAPTIQPPQAKAPPTHRPRTVTPNAQPTTVPANSAPIAEEVGENDVVRVDSHLVVVPASVVDNRGRAINDLKIEDFELRVDGQVKPLSDLRRSETPVRIAVLFDNSASLSAARDLEKQAATRFFRHLVRPIDRAAIFSISTVPTLEQPLTNDVHRLVRTIERFGKPEGATALFDTIAQAADYLGPLPGRKVIVIISDGTDTVSRVGLDEALRRTLRAGCQIYAVQTRQIEDPNLHDPVAERRLDELTVQTGGAVYAPRAVEDLDAAFTQISLDLAQQYVLSYYPQDHRKDRYFRFIGLRVKTRPNLRVRTRRGFYPDAAQNQAAALVGGGMTRGESSTDLVSGATRKPVQAADVVSSVTGKGQFVTQGRLASGMPDKNINFKRRVGPAGPDEEEESNKAAPSFETVRTSTASMPAPTSAPRPSADAGGGAAFGSPVGTTGERRIASAPVTNNENQNVRRTTPPITVKPREAAPGAKPDARPPSGSWFVICGSFPRTQHGQAQGLLFYLREKGYDANIVETDHYPNLRRNLLAVVMGPYSKDRAQSLRGKTLSEVAQGCYVKSGW